LLLSAEGTVSDTLPITNPFWAPDSRRAAYVDRTQIYVWPDRTLVGGGNNFISAPTWSPSGDRIAYSRVVLAPGTPHSELVVAATDRSGEATVFAASAAGQPEWSPDGSSLTFVADGAPNLYVATPTGATSTR